MAAYRPSEYVFETGRSLMALVIFVGEGKPFYVDDTPVYVDQVINAQEAVLRVGKDTFKIGLNRATKVLDGVMVAVGLNGKGKPSPSEPGVRLLVTAPKSIKILREKLYLGSDHCKKTTT